ncbi:MAG: hypothetical protein F6K56_22280 [Moorea sp. SIO3G5]|nr:hypothetical protein [Moorena sp. SIO3G5]
MKVNLQPSTFNLQPSTSNLQPPTFNLQPSTFNLQPSTLNLQLSLNPQPSTKFDNYSLHQLNNFKGHEHAENNSH